MSIRIRICSPAELPPGSRRCLDAEGRSIAVLNVGGVYHAIENNCPHRGGPVGEGELDGTRITCPWHGWTFDLETGQCTTNRAAIISRYECHLEGDGLFVDL